MVLIYQVLIKQCLKKVLLTSNDFVPNGSSLLKCEPVNVDGATLLAFPSVNSLLLK